MIGGVRSPRSENDLHAGDVRAGDADRERQTTAGRLTMEEFSAWSAAVYRVAHDV
jgi:hypothetical protein